MGRNSRPSQTKSNALPIDSITNTLNQTIDAEVYKDVPPLKEQLPRATTEKNALDNLAKTQNTSSSKPTFSFQNNESEGVRKTYVIDSLIDNAIEGIVTDKRTGKKIPGTKGFISKLVNNALRKELIELGVLPPSELEKNEEY
ncbi:hypothetical protein ABS754_002878 [Listeria monocytogenes]|nr:hypothetical protein [Listeria monocytogenes]EAD6491188.1 hypothetical protein [Listeria monocytogenes]EAE6308150.1 hypothetical protein [Listeria monocytogenes]EAE6915406.1 hypothetical protein [Listeria monocytogenes]EAF0293177.1 hypothetical protein [Listeria monocytogenes]